MDVPVFMELDSDNGVGPLIALVPFVNEKCNEISQRAWEHHALERHQIEELVGDDLRYGDKLHPSLVQTVIDRVADALIRNRAKYPPTFDPRASVLLREASGVITFDPQRGSRHVEIWTLEGKFAYQATLGDLYPPQAALLEYRTVEYGLIADFGDDGAEAEYCYLGVVCRVSNVAARAFKMVEWMPRVIAPQSLGQPVEIPAALEDIIPHDHPLRDTVSVFELRESPFFSVKNLAMVMGVPVERIYPMIDRKQIASERSGGGIKVPRAEFTRLAALYLYQQAGAKREVLAAAQEIEKAARRLRQAVEPAG